MFWTVTLSLLGGMGQLLKLFFLTLLFSLPLGLLIAFALRSRCKPVSWLFNVIVWIIRGTPLMLQLIIIFYGPGKWFNNNIWASFSDPRMAACVIAFVINYACYFAVIYRGGIESVPVGQQEAGQVLGMTNFRSEPSRSDTTARTTSGMISPAFWIMTVSPMRMSFSLI
jgi:polar amino acid transport system permease protein